jgi:enamine deaminase RidA (YjgF/YER057c/UK114 family)
MDSMAKMDKQTHQMSIVGENQIPHCLLSEEQHTVLDLGRVHRVALMVTPHPEGDVIDQAWEAISTIRAVMKQQQIPMTVTMQTIFVRSADEIPRIRRLVEAYYANRTPTTSFIVQPPCNGQALVIEAWAVGGEDIDVSFLESGIVTVEYDGLRWIYINGISPPMEAEGAYEEMRYSFGKLAQCLELTGATFNDVTRVWLYQAGITEIEKNPHGQEVERYRELNRSRTDFFEQMEENGKMSIFRDGRACYPASTGIGMAGGGLTVGCMALQSEREDVRLISLENPNQTSAFNYAHRFSAKSPKFSRAMVALTGNYATTWVSGTASILDSESVHLGDIEKQTELTIDNIEALVSLENFRRHGIEGTGALLSDFARVRVYVKKQEDYKKCRAVCQRRFGAVPTIYALADVCRPELLVEIEGVAFSKIAP